MIGEPVSLTVRKDFPRPTPEQIAAFEGLTTSFVVDAQNGTGALDHRIKPLLNEMTFVGPAITAHLEPRDMLPVQPAIALAESGDVLVIETGGYDGAAVVGDNVAVMANNKKIRAIVTDGLVRDVEGILPVGIPVFCTGVSPNSPYSQGPGSVGLPVAMGGTTICSGVLLIGDRDGVVVVARERIDSVLRDLEVVRELEAALEAKVKSGITGMDWVEELLTSDRTRYVD